MPIRRLLISAFTAAFLGLVLLTPGISASDKSIADDEAARNVLAGCEGSSRRLMEQPHSISAIV